MSTLVTGIAELVTNDAAVGDGPLGLVADAAVVVDGRVVVSDGRHVLGDVGALLTEAVTPLWEDA